MIYDFAVYIVGEEWVGGVPHFFMFFILNIQNIN